MNKEIKDRLEKLENELKESKDEIHSLKSAVSLKIERGIGKLLSRFTRKQIILGSLIVLFSISIIGIAGTVTKTYTFSSGDVVSASKINTNFDTLYTLVNGNLDGANISIDPDSIVFFATHELYTGNLGGRSGADAICLSNMDNKTISMVNHSCSNVRAVISIDANDEIRDMATNYSIPTNVDLRGGSSGARFGISWDNFTSATNYIPITEYINEMSAGNTGASSTANELLIRYWSGSSGSGALLHNCSNFTEGSSVAEGTYGDASVIKSNQLFRKADDGCNTKYKLLCICY